MEITERYDFRQHIWCPELHPNVPPEAAEGDCTWCPGVKLLVRDLNERRSDIAWSVCPCCGSAQYYEPDTWVPEGSTMSTSNWVTESGRLVHRR